jgi:hypothetical protein
VGADLRPGRDPLRLGVGVAVLHRPRGLRRDVADLRADCRGRAPGLEGTLRVELSRDGGATFEPLFAGVAASAGKRKWVATGPKTTAAVIRVTSESDTRSQRFSPAFTIR